MESLFPDNISQHDISLNHILYFMIYNDVIILNLKIYHGHEWYGFENIPEDGGLIIYYHGVVPVDYFGLIAKIWTEKRKVVHSVVDR